ncbi:RacGEF [Acrasis kona]|uniref:RacGEF n=1 Tax=Acrasis kona TaxID=1008807 RepID=A0AAW2ZNJ7_9EUKA
MTIFGHHTPSQTNMSNSTLLFIVLVLISYVICNCPSARSDKAEQRANIVKEIYSTEEAYVGALKTLNDKVIEPTKKQRLLTVALFKQYFSSISALRPINEKFLAEIKAHLQIEDMDERAVALVKTFAEYTPAFKLYIDYLKVNLANTLAIKAEITKKSKFGKFLTGLARTTDVKDVTALYVTPAQRLPRYSLLLCELAKTYTAGDDYDRVTNALNEIKKVLTTNNDKMKQSDDQNRLVAINKQFKVPQVTPHRKFVTEFVNSGIKCGDGNIKAKTFKLVNCSVYVFNDLLVVNKKTAVLNGAFQIGLKSGLV